MTIVLKIVAYVVLGAGIFMLARQAVQALHQRGSTLLQERANWMASEFQAMYREMTVERARAILAFTSLGGFVFGFLLGDGIVSRILLAGIAGAVGYLVPGLAVRNLRKRRVHAIDEQLVDALQLMANGLRSGLSLQQSLELVVHEMKPPVSDEFGRVAKEIQLGRLTDEALAQLAERLPLEDLRLAVDAILTLRETGGNLSETFHVIADTIVERKRVEGKIRALTTQSMMQGYLLCAMPFVLALTFSLVDPSFMKVFFTTVLGWFLMFIVLVLDGLGLWMMLKISRVRV